MEEKKQFIDPMIIQLDNYTSPEVMEVQGKNWVAYGDDNDYFGYLLDRYRGSPTNHAIINAVSDQIVGNGLTSEMKQQRSEAWAMAQVLYPYEHLHRFAFDLKCYGWYMQVYIMSDDLKEIERVDYTPVQNWRAGKADIDGTIREYWYSDNWQEIRKKQFKPKPYPVYDADDRKGIMVMPVMPYRSGSFYYPTVDYQGALQYAHIEEEISNFHLSNIMNGLAPSMIINFNNGDPGQEERNLMEARIKSKWGGTSKAGKFILSFNDDKETAATIETVQISDLDKQYQFLSEESVSKIMVGHRVTSPLFFGIRDTGGGLGSNADEIKNSWLLWERTVLRPYRLIMLNAINFTLNQNGQPIILDFESMTPIEFEDPNAIDEPKQIEQHLGSDALDKFIGKGETINSDWILIDERPVDYHMDDKQDLFMLDLAKVVNGDMEGESEQDNPIFKIRYVYAPSLTGQGKTGESREFCTKMVSAGKVYKKEDIQAASSDPVNAGWGPRGAATYDVWLYKGGGNCYHYWQRQTYLQKDNARISVNEARKILNELPTEVRDEYRIMPNDPRVAQLPIDMPNRGFLPKT